MRVWKGNEDLRGMLYALTFLDEDQENARIHPPENLAALRTSLSMFGQVKPVVAWRSPPRRETPGDGRPEPNTERMTIVAGNGTMRAAKTLNWTHLAVSVFSGTLAEARAYALADNRIPELATWDVTQAAFQLDAVVTTWRAEAVEWSPSDLGLDAFKRPSPTSDAREPREPREPRDIEPRTTPAARTEPAAAVPTPRSFRLGSHVLSTCANPTSADTIASLVVFAMATPQDPITIELEESHVKAVVALWEQHTGSAPVPIKERIS